MKLYIFLCALLATGYGQAPVKHPNHKYEPEVPDDHDDHDDHEAQASDGVPSTILAPHHHPHARQTPHQHPEAHHTPHHPPEIQPAFHQPGPTPHTQALKSYYPGRKRYHAPPKQRYHGPHRPKGHHKYHRRPQGHYQTVFGGRPGSKYPSRPGGNFGPRPMEHFRPAPQAHRPHGPTPNFITKPYGHHNPLPGFNPGGLSSKPFSGVAPSSLGAHGPHEFGGFGSQTPGYGGSGASAGVQSLGSGSLGHHFGKKPASGLEVSGHSGFDPGHLGAGNDLGDEGGEVGSESHYVGTYEGGGGGGGGKWKGGGDVVGRVKIKVFRGPTQSDGHKHFAPWGYFVSQPNEESLAKKSRPDGYHGHY